MEFFFILGNSGTLLSWPFISYDAAKANVEMLGTVGSKAEFPLKIEKYFLCKTDNGACAECLRILKERGDKVKAALRSATMLGVGIKPHA